jgi:hypothetical protein
MNIIFILHTILFIAAVVIPFTNNKDLLGLYSLTIPFLMFHWVMNDDTCALTQIEMYVTGNDKEGTFFGRLISPVYSLSDSDADRFVKGLLFLLWIVVQFRLNRIPGVDKIRELYK